MTRVEPLSRLLFFPLFRLSFFLPFLLSLLENPGGSGAQRVVLSLISVFKFPSRGYSRPCPLAFTGASIGRLTPDFLTNGRRPVFRSNRLCRSAVSPGE
jgi:hypothetical protein